MRAEDAGAAAAVNDSQATEEDEEPEESEVSSEEPVVTETMAELYYGQGLYEDALKVYRQLAEGRPDDAGLQERIREIEEKLAGQPSRPQDGEEQLAELLELTQPDSRKPGGGDGLLRLKGDGGSGDSDNSFADSDAAASQSAAVPFLPGSRAYSTWYRTQASR